MYAHYPALALPKVCFYTHLKGCKINNATGASVKLKKCVMFLRGGDLQKNVHMTFFVEKIAL